MADHVPDEDRNSMKLFCHEDEPKGKIKITKPADVYCERGKNLF
jgi:hypothetical protein